MKITKVTYIAKAKYITKKIALLLIGVKELV